MTNYQFWYLENRFLKNKDLPLLWEEYGRIGVKFVKGEIDKKECSRKLMSIQNKIENLQQQINSNTFKIRDYEQGSKKIKQETN